jgi:hypothetical protein
MDRHLIMPTITGLYQFALKIVPSFFWLFDLVAHIYETSNIPLTDTPHLQVTVLVRVKR